MDVICVLLWLGLCVVPIAQEDTSTASNPSPAQSSPKDQEEKPKVPLSQQLSPYFAGLVGIVGGFAYLIAVRSGFVGKDEVARSRILGHFDGFWITVAYVLSAGLVALVFQLPEKDLVPIQAFIIGCTWPAVVGNYISARQSGEGLPDEEARKFRELIANQLQLEKDKEEFSKLIKPSSEQEDTAQDKLREVLNQLREVASPGPPGRQGPSVPPSPPPPAAPEGTASG